MKVHRYIFDYQGATGSLHTETGLVHVSSYENAANLVSELALHFMKGNILHITLEPFNAGDTNGYNEN